MTDNGLSDGIRVLTLYWRDIQQRAEVEGLRPCEWLSHAIARFQMDQVQNTDDTYGQ